MESIDTHPPGSHRKSRFPWFVLLSTVSLGIAVLAVFVSYRYLVPVTLAVQAEDQALLVTAQDLSDFDENLVIRTDADTITKLRMPDETIELDYRYASDNPSAPLFIHCRVATLANRTAARQYFETLQNTPIQPLSPRRTDLRWKVEDSTFAAGDQSRFGKVIDGEEPVGVVFVSRVGHQVFLLHLEGTVVESYGDLAVLTLRPLTNLEARKADSIVDQ